MTQAPQETEPLLTPMQQNQRDTMLNFITLLNEIQALGLHGFSELIDAASEKELQLLAQSASIVRGQIARFKSPLK